MRSDLSRLLTLFSVAIPTNVALEEANNELKYVRHERARLETVNHNLGTDLYTKQKLLEEQKGHQLEIEAELQRMEELEVLVEKLTRPKADKEIQVEMMRETMWF